MTISNVPDLLPESFQTAAPAEPALDLQRLLEHQARLFAERTNGVIQPVVKTKRGILSPSQIGYDFILVVPVLDDYRYGLFTLEAALEAPPAWIHTPEGPEELATEEAIHDKLRELFSAPSTHRVVQSLLALAREESRAP